MAVHMFILETHSGSFLSIFEAESNLFDAFKKVHAAFVIRMFQYRKSSNWGKRLSRWDNFICFHFLIKRFLFPNQESFYSKWTKIYSYWILFDSQKISVSLRLLLLWQVNFYSKQVNSCMFWIFLFS